ncbi:MAG TPA: type VI secretion system baseplate subunit TssK [Candidatus Acidoferrum sp.]|nr:type VI secretion system baseplate subunit TssK [Candidatus Acidoferrum sp.]
MKHLSKVVWHEGMYLGPHHFQVQSQSFEDLVHFSTTSLWFAPYGVATCKLDPEALQNGTLSLVHARGLFPDGLTFQMPDADPLPAPLEIGNLFPPTRESLLVCLCVPERKPDGPNCAFDSDPSSIEVRYHAELRNLPDDNTGCDEKQIEIGRKNIRFAVETQERQGLVALPVARVIRDGSGRFIFDPAFIPPCLQISASDRLLVIARTLVDILDEKSASLSRARRSTAQGRAGYSSEEIASFWFVHTVNESLSVLRHLAVSERGHPEQLYLEMSRLAGALCTFGLDSHPETLPAYNHDDLEKCFGPLNQHIRAHLELVVPSNCIQIPLVLAGRNFRNGEIVDQRCLDRSRWVLAVRADAGEAEIIAKTPRLIKICSKDLLPELVKTALPGLGLVHLPIPPSAIAPKIEFQYFGISRTGTSWDHIVQTRKVGVYVPDEIPGAEIELLVVLES